MCHSAIAEAASKSGVPRDVLLAIALTETGRNFEGRIEPWPWTVNMEGAGLWFASRAEAETYARTHHARGSRSFDVGCFQINYRWHKEHFRSLEEMFDPQKNADYAARFLSDLHRETGSWVQAAAYYHSRTPEFAARYAQRFSKHLARVAGRGDEPVYLGHGSEDLRLAGLTPKAPAPPWPLAALTSRPATEMISSNPTGSLVNTQGGAGLLRPSSGSLF